MFEAIKVEVTCLCGNKDEVEEGLMETLEEQDYNCPMCGDTYKVEDILGDL